MKIALIGTIMAALIVFTVQNEASVSISFLLWQFEVPRAVVIFFAVLAGVLVMQLLQRRGIDLPRTRSRTMPEGVSNRKQRGRADILDNGVFPYYILTMRWFYRDSVLQNLEKKRTKQQRNLKV